MAGVGEAERHGLGATPPSAIATLPRSERCASQALGADVS